MSVLNDIKRIVWHEFGHLCVNSIMVKSVKDIDLNIARLTIHYLNMVDGAKWGGCVQVLPDPGYERAVKNLNYFSLKSISLFSGCLFETLYLNVIQGLDKGIFDCFCNKSNCTGIGDFYTYNSLISELLKQKDREGGSKVVRLPKKQSVLN
ncbi:hypothetical protein LS482_11055 [Sinomicrobium kalidii]|uniref:hypothetical protein n=1 Tax=Sinomicrobium kalidii TaxID=2900738 RepID=UPI001E47235D|nr:hypothetical protein [Sinomicrobium kalidii]UGU14251.1 hypothetical protein LS482_11055 [Sinomicrobium kalidii]